PQIPKAFTRGFGAPFQLTIQSQDLDALNRYAGQLVTGLQQTKMLVNVRSSFEVNKPELRLDIDRDRAAALGVSVEDISRTLQILFGGLDLSRIKIGGKEYYVMAQLARDSRLKAGPGPSLHSQCRRRPGPAQRRRQTPGRRRAQRDRALQSDAQRDDLRH